MRTSSEWGRVDQFSGYVEGEVLPILPDAKDIRKFTRLRSAFNREFEPRSSNLYSRYLQHLITWKKNYPLVKPPLNIPDLTGWGVWGATSWRAIRQIWGQVEYLLRGSVAVEVFFRITIISCRKCMPQEQYVVLSTVVTSLFTAYLLQLWPKTRLCQSCADFIYFIYFLFFIHRYGSLWVVDEQLLSVHSIGNLNSTPPSSFTKGNVFSGPTNWLPWLLGT